MGCKMTEERQLGYRQGRHAVHTVEREGCPGGRRHGLADVFRCKYGRFTSSRFYRHGKTQVTKRVALNSVPPVPRGLWRCWVRAAGRGGRPGGGVGPGRRWGREKGRGKETFYWASGWSCGRCKSPRNVRFKVRKSRWRNQRQGGGGREACVQRKARRRH